MCIRDSLYVLTGEVRCDRRTNTLAQELIYLRRAAADVSGRVEVLKDCLLYTSRYRPAEPERADRPRRNARVPR